MDPDLRSIQEARELVRQARGAQHEYKRFSQEKVDAVVAAMSEAGAREARRLGKFAHEETGFGRPESKEQKNLFATRILHERMAGMRTVGIIRRMENDTIWEVATPMGVVAALIPSTNPTSTAMYKAIIAAKAGCALVMSPHPRAKACTADALKVVAEAAYRAGAPKGLFGCMTEVTLPGTNELLEHRDTDLILATGGTAMVREAYSKGKPAYGVGSGNVPVYVDRSADIRKAAKDILYGASFDWGTLCSTERSIVADRPIGTKLKAALKEEGGYFLKDDEKEKLRRILWTGKGLNVDQVGRSPSDIARMAGFSVPAETKALIGEVDRVGRDEPLSMETLSPILSYYEEDGWQSGCARCIEVLEFGGIGHTLGLHCTNQRIIEEFALEKPSMRIVVNTVAALGSVGYTNRLFPAMTLGPGTLGGSITSDNISPLHLLNIKRLAFETAPIHASSARVVPTASRSLPEGSSGSTARAARSENGSWMDEIERRLRERAGNRVHGHRPSTPEHKSAESRSSASAGTSRAGATGSASSLPGTAAPSQGTSPLPLSEEAIEKIIRKFKKG